MNTRRVLFTASTGSHIRSFHLPYLEQLRRLGWQVDVACGAPAGEITGADRVIELPFEKKMQSPKNFAAAKILRREIKNGDYSLILTHTSLAAFFTRLAVMGLRQRPTLVNMVHGYLFDDETGWLKKRVLTLAERLTRRQTDLLLTMNAWDDAFARKNALGGAVHKIPGIGVDFSGLDTASDANELRLSLGLSANDFVLIYAAEFSDRKNQKMLIEAMPELAERFKLLLPGRGERWEGCKALSKELGVEERVIMPGFVSDMPNWYRVSDAAVSASRSEGLPFNVMEALHLSLPVVASRVKGHTDLIEEGKNGLLYSFGDKRGYLDAVQRLSEDDTLLKSLSAAARDSVSDFGLSRVLPIVMEEYLRAAER